MSDIGSVQMITLQPIQYQLVELSLFYQPQKDNNIYHITCKKITQDHLQGTGNSDDSYDYKFFIESLDDFTTTFHVTCTKLLPNSLILNILNKKFYGFDFDAKFFPRTFQHPILNSEAIFIPMKIYILPIL
ncbi:15256_t:CDS:2 [Rhizophagus irregularis]|nr:15256_t:CDS:2 [Rhizophagus irregularis]